MEAIFFVGFVTLFILLVSLELWSDVEVFGDLGGWVLRLVTRDAYPPDPRTFVDTLVTATVGIVVVGAGCAGVIALIKRFAM